MVHYVANIIEIDTKPSYRLGIDVGSTTAKAILLDGSYEIVHTMYLRHHADVRTALGSILTEILEQFGDCRISPVITGSSGLSLSKLLDIPFVQEVISLRKAVRVVMPETDVAIELGGEDAKIVYFKDGMEQRMNGSCAGGTGAFIDQMASLLDTDPTGLNELAREHTTIYPVASRCGVFAKSDIQPLLNEGARREDIAASIFQAVVNQTIAGLACGRPIRGSVAFLGGPLHYLSELRKRFSETLNLDEEHTLVPELGHLLVAAGAAFNADLSDALPISELQERLANAGVDTESTVGILPALFESEEDFLTFTRRHNKAVMPTAPLENAKGDVYLGIDAGSTTFKMVLIDKAGRLLYEVYRSNKGDVLACAREEIDKLYDALPCDEDGIPQVFVHRALSTGYGEKLLLEALNLDDGEVETVAHLRAAQELCPDVDFILDIGGQDMKCLRISDGSIDTILLNEACSSGCGSFIATFAHSMGFSASEFADEALFAEGPVDLGSRCTVFMNSRVKQAQKEGATIGDIAAGLAYSVIKNALFKVIKARNAESLGEHIVVQGGTFTNNAVLRAFELLCGREVIRPSKAGLMGAWGAALLARDRALGSQPVFSSMLSANELAALQVKHRNARCNKCQNSCLLTINEFESAQGKSRLITGNRCERGAGKTKASSVLPNIFDYKYKRLFDYEPLSAEIATRGTVGIPRVLNMYENYPFWFTFFTELGYRVQISTETSKTVFEMGMESIPSESVCYPAKLAHGHIMDLLNRDIDFIFLPCIRNERIEDENAANCFNCPIVSSYPETLRLNIDELRDSEIPLIDPYLPYASKKHLGPRLVEELAKIAELKGLDAPTLSEVRRALDKAWAEDESFKEDIHNKGAETLRWLEETGNKGIVLVGRPYHVDPEVNHSLPELVNSLGYAVLTEDSVAWMARPERDLRVVDQWMYHSRLYAAAKLVTTRADLELVQLNSFGCGLDAVTTDEVQEIMEGAGRAYTLLKIDEVSNLGAARIRLRSLQAALIERGDIEPTPTSTAFPKVPFTQEMKDEGYTIIAPQMAPIHFNLLTAVFKSGGYNLEVLPEDDGEAVEAGLKYVNNDICYPSILTTGQIMAAVESGKYDLDKLAVMITQTGGGCRATNYIALIRKGLREAGHPNIPVISLAFKTANENNPGWKMTPEMIAKAYFAIVTGDIISQCLYRTRPYEAIPNSANELSYEWQRKAKELFVEPYKQGPIGFTRGIRKEYKRYIKLCCDIIKDFDELPLANDRSKPRIGVVGEILVKYHPTANNHLVDVIEREGCEAVVPGLADFFQFAGLNNVYRHEHLDTPRLSRMGGELMYWAINKFRSDINKALAASNRFEVAEPVAELAHKSEDIVQLCNNMGEGWLMTAEMIELIEQGSPNIVLCSPFGCLPNHVIGKAVMKELHHRYPTANIAAIDYDPGASEVNQINRIKLMATIAREEFAREQAAKAEGENDIDPKAPQSLREKLGAFRAETPTAEHLAAAMADASEFGHVFAAEKREAARDFANAKKEAARDFADAKIEAAHTFANEKYDAAHAFASEKRDAAHAFANEKKDAARDFADSKREAYHTFADETKDAIHDAVNQGNPLTNQH